MPTIPQIMVYTIVNIIPLLVLALLPFRDSLRFPARVTALMALVLCLIDACTSILALKYDAGGFFSTLSIFLYFVFYLSAVRAVPFRLLTILLILMNFASLASVTTSFFCSLLEPELSYPAYSWEYTAIYAFAILLAFPFYYMILNRRIRPQVTAVNTDPFWRYLWVVPATFCIVFYYALFSGGGLVPFSASWKNLLFIWVINAGSLLVYHIMACLLEEGRKNLRLQTENDQLTLQVAQYEILRKNIEETRRARHDLRQHLKAIQGCIDTHSWEALDAYVKTYREQIPPESLRTYCKIPSVDAVLRFYAEKAAQNHIDMPISFQTGEKAIIPEPDFCVLLGNLLENAIEACLHAQGDPFIKVNALQHGESMLSLTIDNTSGAPPKWKGQELISGKHKGMGNGTRSVRMIAERYDGNAKFEWKDGVFYASVILNPER